MLVEGVVGERGEFAELSDAYAAAMGDSASPIRKTLARSFDISKIDPERAVFFDLETTGLTGERGTAFLVGTMVWEGNGFVVRQYLARDDREEPGSLALFLETLGAGDWFVSFNGKSFDVPFLRKRAERHGLPFNERLPHLDMLHVGRRAWGHALPNCRLQTLERAICGRGRDDDIPSSEIPAAYRVFTRTGDGSDMRRILEHNALDLMTLADLMVRLPEGAVGRRTARRPRRSVSAF